LEGGAGGKGKVQERTSKPGIFEFRGDEAFYGAMEGRGKGGVGVLKEGTLKRVGRVFPSVRCRLPKKESVRGWSQISTQGIG